MEIPKSIVENIYESALRIRTIEDGISSIYHLREMRTPTHLYTGQEAIAAGACQALETKDLVYSYYRSHGWYLAKGGNLNRMMAELFGKATGCSKGFGGSMHLIDLEAGFTGTSAIVAGAIPHAVGGAFTFQYRKTQNVVLSCFGDGATEEGLFQESLMFASLRKIPVIFLCENNGLATNTWIKDRQPNVPIYKRAEGLGVRSEIVDGNDGLAVYAAVKKAVDLAREGAGPSFIECTTYRLLEHCGPNRDTALGARTDAEVDEWKFNNDPVKRLEKHVSPEFKARVLEKAKKDFDMAVEQARKDPFPTSLIPEGLPCQL